METQNMCVTLKGLCVSACGCGQGGGPNRVKGACGGGGGGGSVKHADTPQVVVFHPGMDGGDGFIEISTR